jgi:hypothetical protein
MKTISLLFLSLMLLSSCLNNKPENKTDTFPVLRGQYFGQEKPGLLPKIFAPGIISTGKYELNSVFSPDYSEFYFTIRLLSRQMVIMCIKNENNQWTSPEVVSFSGKYEDADPFITNDGKWLYFTSKRPVDSSQVPNDDFEIWRSQRTKNGWEEPQRLDSTVNSKDSEVYPTLTKDGTLYFSRFCENGSDIYFAESNDNGFKPAQKVDAVINEFGEGDVFISPNEDYMIFSSRGRKEGNGLFISFKESNKWTVPEFMGKDINQAGMEYCPMVTPDGKYLFFTSERDSLKSYSDVRLNTRDIWTHYENILTTPKNKLGDIYWVDAKIIDNYKKE